MKLSFTIYKTETRAEELLYISTRDLGLKKPSGY